MDAAPKAEPHYFLRDIVLLRDAAAAMMRVAAPSRGGSAIYLLQTLLAAEIVCMLRYTALSVAPLSLEYDKLGLEFEEKAQDERRHMGALADRIAALGGVPDFAPEGLASRKAAALAAEQSLLEIVTNNLMAERAVIKLYRASRRYLAKRDKESAALLQLLLIDEEQHIAGMRDMVLPVALPSKPILH